MWALQKLRKLMTAHFGANININVLLQSPSTEGTEVDPQKPISMVSIIN